MRWQIDDCDLMASSQERPTEAELSAARDVIACAKAANPRIGNADELLVCAAIALRAGEFGGVATRAAKAMGKHITKPKSVNDWVERIRQLERAREAATKVAVTQKTRQQIFFKIQRKAAQRRAAHWRPQQ